MDPQERFNQKWTRDPSTGCHVWTACTDKDGYGLFKYEGSCRRSHRWIWEQEKGTIPEGLVVRHITCSNPACVNAEHLVLGTHADNVRDRIEDGNTARGERSGRAKLSREDVCRIRRCYEEEETSYRKLAKGHGVSEGCIGRVIRRETWSHLS